MVIIIRLPLHRGDCSATSPIIKVISEWLVCMTDVSSTIIIITYYYRRIVHNYYLPHLSSLCPNSENLSHHCATNNGIICLTTVLRIVEYSVLPLHASQNVVSVSALCPRKVALSVSPQCSERWYSLSYPCAPNSGIICLTTVSPE